MDTPLGRTHGARFALRVAAWALGAFALLRVPWVEVHMLLPFTRAQGRWAAGLFGAPAAPVEITLSCSGADALALALGAVLAYPVRWRSRATGVGLVVALILILNVARIGTLGQAAASPEWFNTLHLYVWPALLTIAIAFLVFGWMSFADRDQPRRGDRPTSVEPVATWPAQAGRRFVLLTIAFLLLFALTSPFYLEGAGVLAIAGFIARWAAAALEAAGVSAQVAGNVLWTSGGAFVVTQECVSTPLIPVYLAAVCSYLSSWRRLLGLAATVPLFVALGIIRLLGVALPEVLGSPVFLVHAFYQILLAVTIIVIAALWRHGGRAGLGRAGIALAAGGVVVVLCGPPYTRLLMQTIGAPSTDPQGAIALLPSFQVGFYVALWTAAIVAVSWTRFFAGLAMLGCSHAVGLVALHALASGFNVTAHVRDVRGWAVAGPLLMIAAVLHGARARR